jgi:hypothetical protein
MAIHADSLESLARQLSDEATEIAYALQDEQPEHSAIIARLASIIDSLLDGIRTGTERNQRIADLVCADGSTVYKAITPGHVVVVDGRTGLDACEKSASECFDALFREQDGGESPGRIEIRAATGEMTRV